MALAPPQIVAEIGINHGGDVKRALEMVKQAAKSGADAVKTQYHIPEREMAWGQGIDDQYTTIESCQLSDREERDIQLCAHDNGIEYFSTPFCLEALDRLIAMDVSIIKIGSGEVSNYPLLLHAAETGCSIYLSTGMHKIVEIEAAKSFFWHCTLLHCVSRYPAESADLNMPRFQRLKRLADSVGYSSHYLGQADAVVATTLGASVIEKHFTLGNGIDDDVSLFPSEFAEMAAQVHATARMNREAWPDESEAAQWAKHGLYAALDITAGEKLNDYNVEAKRPIGRALPASFGYFGVQTKLPIRAGEPITVWDLNL